MRMIRSQRRKAAEAKSQQSNESLFWIFDRKKYRYADPIIRGLLKGIPRPVRYRQPPHYKCGRRRFSFNPADFISHLMNTSF
jgi:hypothetical protein